jgi:hypothetical protein
MPERGIEVGFGSLIKTRQDDEEGVYVLIDVKRVHGEIWFSMAPIGEVNNEKYFIGGGSEVPENIAEVLGKMSPEEVLDACKLGCKLDEVNEKITNKLIRVLKKNSRKKLVVIELSD